MYVIVAHIPDTDPRTEGDIISVYGCGGWGCSDDGIRYDDVRDACMIAQSAAGHEYFPSSANRVTVNEVKPNGSLGNAVAVADVKRYLSAWDT